MAGFKNLVVLIYSAVVNYLFPPRCLSCYELNTLENGFCADCWSKLDFISKPYCITCGYALSVHVLENQVCAKCSTWPPHYDKLRSIMKFNEYSKLLIHAFKYYDKTNLAKVFAQLICNRYGSEIADVDIIIPVPMHKLKRLFRMYNQSYLLALEISKIISKPLYYDLLVKSKWTKSQTSLSRSKRKKNLAGSISLKSPELAKGKKVLLVDDVKTTGATIDLCSKILKKAKAKNVYVITIAMTIND